MIEDRPLHFEAHGILERTEDGDITHELNFKLRDEAKIPPVELLVGALGDNELGYRALNEASGLAEGGAKFKNALKQARDEGLITQDSETKLYRKVA